MNIAKVVPAAYRAVFGLEKYVSENVPTRLYHLVKLRASVLNGCAFCIQMHTKHALAQGETTERLFAVSAWWEADCFSDEERAALALTDAVTRLGEHGVPDDVWNEVTEVFTQEEVAHLVVAIATINVWNRIAVTTKMPPSQA